MVLLACRSYAADHGGAYPPDLAALFPDYIDTEDYHLAEDGRGGKVPMIYFSGLTTSDDPEAILIEHRVLYARKRVVGKVGGHIKLLQVDQPDPPSAQHQSGNLRKVSVRAAEGEIVLEGEGGDP